MPQSILKSRRFLPLLITQFFGALNDNLFKNALLLMVTVKMAQQAAVLSNVIAGLFILPFFIFSATAGEISDKYDKSRIAQILKVTELVLMVMAAIVYT
ncbi:MAG: glycerol acyltransferase, partial [Alphaproteobacteria bacterium]|nr:glycerol acyltransferase [Alphaproteobacteria bacterium]